MFKVHVPQLVKVADLNPAGYNPRTITLEKYEALKENIRSEGFIEPLVVQKTGLRIIGGHQRVRAVKELSIEVGEAPPDLPCMVLDIDDTRAKKLNIKLNKLKGDFEARMLGELLIDIFDDANVPSEEAMLLGFSAEEALKYTQLIEPPPEPEPGPIETFGRSVTLSLEFKDTKTRDAVKELLQKRSSVEKKTSGEIVAALLRARPQAKKSKAQASA